MKSFKKEFIDTGIIEKAEMFSFGSNVNNITEKSLVKYGGGHKFSYLCGFKFRSGVFDKFPIFRICFVAKLRSNIYRIANQNPSMWFAMVSINAGEEDKMLIDEEDLLKAYKFDLNEFFETDSFLQSVQIFKKAIANGIDYAKKNIGKNLRGSDYAHNVGRYIDAISDSLKYIDDKRLYLKRHPLIDLDKNKKKFYEQ